MRSIIVACALLCPLIVRPADAQTLRANKIFPEETQRAAVVERASRSDGVTATASAQVLADEGKQRDVLLLLPTVPVTFNALHEDSVGEWHFGNAMTLGAGVTFVLGKATYNGASATVDPWILAGAALNAGIREDDDRKVAETLSFSGFFGLGDVAVNFSWPLFSGERSIGLSLKVDVLTNMAPDAFMCFRGCNR
jgi:hypothetical protein